MSTDKEEAETAYWNYIGAKRKLDSMSPGDHSYQGWVDAVNSAYNKAIRYGITGQQMRELEIKHKKQFRY